MTLARGPALVREARRSGYAIPAFNVSNLETAQAVVAAAERAAAPVIVQLSPGAITYAGYDVLVRIVFDLGERALVPVLVHLDHCTDPGLIARAISDGFGSVMFDGSRLAYRENVAATVRVVARAAGAGVAVEAELGLIGVAGETTLDEAVAGRTTPEDAARFVAETGIDVLAPAIGNLHKMPVDSVVLDVDHLAAVARAADRPIALHGGSGVDRGRLRRAIEAGVAKVNLSSTVSRALAAGIRATWDQDPAELDLRRFLGAGRDAVGAMAADYFERTGARERAPAAGARDAVGAVGPVGSVGASFRSGGSEDE